MGTGSFGTDTTGMSEAIGVGVLIALTVVVTAMVGVNVLVEQEDDSGGPQANFTYDHIEDSGVLIVTHSRGDDLEAGKIEFDGPGETATWAQLADRNETALIGPGSLTQLSAGNAYGQPVNRGDTIAIYYNQSGNRTQLDQWNGG